MIEAVNPPGAAFPGVSQATIARGGDIMILSGHVPTDADGEVVDGDFEAQVRAVFANLEQTLAAAGASFHSVLRFTYYVTAYEPALLSIIKKVRTPLLSTDAPPASALVAVTELYDPRVRIEIDAVALVPPRA